MPRPVLYLDFDDVLNDQEWSNSPERDALVNAPKPNGLEAWEAWQMELAMADIRPEYAALVKEIVDRTGCRIVVCSNWRKTFSNERLNAVLAPHGLQHEGVTRRPRVSEHHDIRLEAILGHAATLETGTRWCVLDDAIYPQDVGSSGGYAVPPLNGVQRAHVEEVVGYLLADEELAQLVRAIAAKDALGPIVVGARDGVVAKAQKALAGRVPGEAPS